MTTLGPECAISIPRRRALLTQGSAGGSGVLQPSLRARIGSVQLECGLEFPLRVQAEAQLQVELAQLQPILHIARVLGHRLTEVAEGPPGVLLDALHQAGQPEERNAILGIQLHRSLVACDRLSKVLELLGACACLDQPLRLNLARLDPHTLVQGDVGLVLLVELALELLDFALLVSGELVLAGLFALGDHLREGVLVFALFRLKFSLLWLITSFSFEELDKFILICSI